MADVVIQEQADVQSLYDSIAADISATPMRSLHEAELAIVDETAAVRFDSGTQPDGSTQPPLAASTIRRKGHSRILQESDRLLRSLTDTTHPDAIVEIVDEPGNGGLGRGTAVEYSAAHNRAVGNRPARPHVGISEGDFDAYANRSMDNAIEQLKLSGR